MLVPPFRFVGGQDLEIDRYDDDVAVVGVRGVPETGRGRVWLVSASLPAPACKSFSLVSFCILTKQSTHRCRQAGWLAGSSRKTRQTCPTSRAFPVRTTTTPGCWTTDADADAVCAGLPSSFHYYGHFYYVLSIHPCVSILRALSLAFAGSSVVCIPCSVSCIPYPVARGP